VVERECSVHECHGRSVVLGLVAFEQHNSVELYETEHDRLWNLFLLLHLATQQAIAKRYNVPVLVTERLAWS